MPTRPWTDWINFSESYPTPSLKTISTFSMSLIVVAGLPFTTIRSACLPGAIDPMRASSPRNFAPLSDAIMIASGGVKPASTSSSTSRRSPKPATIPPLPVGSRPAMSSPPAFTNARSKSIALRNSGTKFDSDDTRARADSRLRQRRAGSFEHRQRRSHRYILRNERANRLLRRGAVQIELPETVLDALGTLVRLLVRNKLRISKQSVLEIVDTDLEHGL